MNQLSEITFINAGPFPFARLSMDGNTLLSGRNGVGKTTIMRAVLFFYGVSQNNRLGLARDKKKETFEQYYFKNANSYLVYRYQNRHGAFLIITYRNGARIQFRFVVESVPCIIEDVFIGENGIVRAPEELWTALRAQDYTHSDIVTSPAEYRRILYGQNRKMLSYALIPSNSNFEQIPKTLSNIFLNSKLDSGSIKKMLAGTTNAFDAINLSQTHRQLDEFLLQYDDIKRYEKYASEIEVIGQILVSYDKNNERLHQNARQLFANVKELEKKRIETDRRLEQIVLEISQTEEEWKKIESIFQKVSVEKIEKQGVLKKKVEEIEEKRATYQSQGIEQKLKEWEQKPLIDSELLKTKEQLAKLLEGQRSIEERFKALKDEAVRSYRESEYEIQQQLNGLVQDFNSQKEALRTEVEKKKELETQTIKEQIDKTGKLLIEASTKHASAVEQERSCHKEVFLHDEIIHAKKIYDHTVETYNKTQNTINEYKTKLESLDTKESSLDEKLKYEIEGITREYKQQRDTLKNELEKINRQLNIDPASFLGFVHAERVKNIPLISALLKDEILHSTKLAPRIDEENSSILGIALDLQMIDVSPYEQEALDNKLKTLEKNLADLEKSFSDKQDKLTQDNREQQQKIRGERSRIKTDYAKLEQELEQLKLEKFKHKDEIDRLEEKAAEHKKEAILLAQKKLAECEKDLENAKKIHVENEKKLSERLAQIQDEFKKNLTGIEQKYDALMDEKKKLLGEQQTKHAQESAQLEEHEKQALLEGGVDQKMLEGYKIQLTKLEQQQEYLKSIQELIYSYKQEQKELEKYDVFRQELKAIQEENLQFNNDHQKQKEVFDSKKNMLLERKKEIEISKREITNSRESFEEFTRGSIYPIISFHEGEDVLPANELSITSLCGKIQESARSIGDDKLSIMRKIENFLGKLRPGNVLNLSKPHSNDNDTLLKAARELKEFFDEAKIETFKDMIATQYNQLLRNLSKESKGLFDAENIIVKTIRRINKILEDLQGIQVIKLVELRFKNSDDRVIHVLKSINRLTEEYPFGNERSLFVEEESDEYNKKSLKLLTELSTIINDENRKELRLEDGFELEIRAIENQNDTGFVASLDGIGSHGTDVMIKTMVNIAMLYLSLDQTTKEKQDVFLHCILDEVGVLSPSYLKELIAYANNKFIRFFNGAPDEKLVTTYKRIYMLSMGENNHTVLRKLVSKK